MSAEYDQLCENYEVEDYEDPFTDKDRARLAEIEPVLTEFRNRAPKLSAKQIAPYRRHHQPRQRRPPLPRVRLPEARECQAGNVDTDRPDRDTAATDDQEGDDDTGTDYVHADNNPAAIVGGKPLSDSPARDLTSYRTIALQNALAPAGRPSFQNT